MKKILLACYLVLVSIALMIAPIHAENVDGEAVTAESQLSFETFVCSDRYTTEEQYRSNNSVGNLAVQNAAACGKQTRDGVDIYTTESGSVNFSLCYHIPNKLFLDYQTQVGTISAGASVQRGAIIVLTKNSPQGDYQLQFTAVDVLRTHPQGIDSLYQPSTQDLETGVYIKFVFVFAFYQDNIITRQLQVAECFIVKNTTPYIVDLAQNGGVLSNGSTTTKGFVIEGVQENTEVSVAFNGSNFSSTDQKHFEIPGKYQIRFNNFLLEKQEEITVFILPSREKTFQMYFGGSIVSERTRIFTTSIYPTYSKVAILQWNTDRTLPPLFGEATSTDGVKIPIDYQTGSLCLPQGEWRIEMTTGVGTGSFYSFNQAVEVLEIVPEIGINEYLILLWKEDGNSIGDFRPIFVPFQADLMVAVESDGSAKELTEGVPLGKQLEGGCYTIKELNKKSGQTYQYEIEIDDVGNQESIGVRMGGSECITNFWEFWLIVCVLVVGFVLIVTIIIKRRRR